MNIEVRRNSIYSVKYIKGNRNTDFALRFGLIDSYSSLNQVLISFVQGKDRPNIQLAVWYRK